MSLPANSYDSVPYPSLAFLQTHPDRLAVLGTLFGMNPTQVEHCRVLEIACGDGSNLIPMAYVLPGSEFVGIDLAGKPIEAGQRMIKRASLTNIRMEQMDLMELGAEFGEFDYIIAHGVYAWVPQPVQAKILAICKANLSANGVAFVSYNTNPAGHIRQILRKMMHYHERRTTGSENRVTAAKQFFDSILKATGADSSWKALLQNELKLMFNRDERVVYHDDLSESFSPVTFSDFVERAARCGLQYLSEALLNEVLEPELSVDALAALNQLAGGDLIAYQQYFDFARCRRFRQTLLCHTEVPLRSDGVLERAEGLLVASPMRASAEQTDGAVEFTNGRGPGNIKTNNPVVIAVLRRLEQVWPRGEKFEDLVSNVLPLVPEAQRTEVSNNLAHTVLKLSASKLADLRTYQLPLAELVSKKPVASLLARLMAQEGTLVTTLLHTHINIEDEQGRKFLQLLDGTRDRQALADTLGADPPDTSRETILRQIDGNLINFCRIGLLVS
jgi:methyltransferase-like protein/protein-L-isoaspartate O-methyltransferase